MKYDDSSVHSDESSVTEWRTKVWFLAVAW